MAAARNERRSQAERRDEAEQRLLAAAVGLVGDRGLDRLTLADVGEAAGYSRGLPAHYFGSKAGLVVALASHLVENFIQALGRAEHRPSGLKRLLATTGFYFDSVAKNPARARALFVLLSDAMSNPLIRDRIATLNARSAKGFEVELRAAIAAGQVRPDIDPAVQGLLVLSTLRGAVGQWLLAPDAIDLDAVRDAFLANLERSLAR